MTHLAHNLWRFVFLESWWRSPGEPARHVPREWVEAIKPPSDKPVAISPTLDGRPRTERSTALRTRTPVITL
jgi:hypothetical protein